MNAPAEPAEPVHQPPTVHGRPGARSSLLVLIAVAVVCTVVAAGLVMNAERLGLAPASKGPGVTIARDNEDAAALRARIAELEQALAEARAAPAAPSQGFDAGQTAALVSRIERLEETQRRASRAASAAIAAAALADAAQTSRPFQNELAVLERLSFDPEQLSGLRPLARTGAPTRAALAAEFPAVAARAAAAAREAPQEGRSFLDRALGALGSMFTLRRVDTLTGSSADAVLARAERRAVEGDVEGALEQLGALPPAAQTATADWRERARRRVELERRIAALRAEALRDLAEGAATEGPQP